MRNVVGDETAYSRAREGGKNKSGAKRENKKKKLKNQGKQGTIGGRKLARVR